MTDPATKAVSLPIVAWRFHADGDESHWMHAHDREAGIKVIGAVGGIVTTAEPLTPHAPAQAEIERLSRELDHAIMAADCEATEVDLRGKTIDRLREALEEVCDVLETNTTAIIDTVWVSTGQPETLLDHCRAALTAGKAPL